MINLNGKNLTPELLPVAVVKVNGKAVDYQFKSVKQVVKNNKGVVAYSTGVGLMPLIREYASLSEYLAIGVLMFAGTLWIFGHRTRAVEMVIGVVIGYEIILHAEDFIHYLTKLKG